jgi:alkylation response protein AidB-like acyl-CoA dehydrogenase
MKIMNLKVLAATQEGAAPGLESSMLKIKGTEIQQSINHLTRQMFGPYAACAIDSENGIRAEEFDLDYARLSSQSARASAKYFNYRKLSIFGGSNEIQKTIIAKHQLNF